MQPHDQTAVLLPHDQVCEMVAGAGFDGMTVSLLGPADLSTARALLPHLQRNGLRPVIVAFPQTIDGLSDALHLAADLGAPYVDVIGEVMPIALDDMVPVVEAWMAMADRAGVPVLFETHRNSITNDLFATLQLLDRLPGMRLCADLSHYVVGREFWSPVSDGDRALISRILRRSDSFHGRVASREQVQVQLDFPQHRAWVDLFKSWWREGLADWRRRNGTGDCIFVCELGPPEYAMTGPDGRELSNRWEEAKLMKSWVRQIWNDLGGDY